MTNFYEQQKYNSKIMHISQKNAFYIAWAQTAIKHNLLLNKCNTTNTIKGGVHLAPVWKYSEGTVMLHALNFITRQMLKYVIWTRNGYRD